MSLSLITRANALRQYETDPIKQEWWVGYLRGLRRAHHGENFGTTDEHNLYLNAITSSDPSRAALGRGYHDGLTLTVKEPPENA